MQERDSGGRPTPSSHVYSGHNGAIMASSVSPSGEHFVTASTDHTLRLHRIPQNGSKGPSSHASAGLDNLLAPRYRREGHSDWVTCVTHLDEWSFVSGGADNRLTLWSPSSVPNRGFPRYRADTCSLLASVTVLQADRSQLACGDEEDEKLSLDDGVTPFVTGDLKGECTLWADRSLSDSPQSQGSSSSTSLVSGSLGLGPYMPVKRFACRGGQVTCVDWMHSLMCTGMKDGTVCLWDVESGREPVFTLNAHLDRVTKARVLSSLDHEPSGALKVVTSHRDLLVSAGRLGTFQVLDMRSQAYVLRKKFPKSSAITDFSFLHLPGQQGEQLYLALGMVSGSVPIFDVRNMSRPVVIMTGHKSPVTNITLQGTQCDPYIFSAATNGWLMCHSLARLHDAEFDASFGQTGISESSNGKKRHRRRPCVFATGAQSKGLVHSLESSGSCVLASGDDGTTMCLDMHQMSSLQKLDWRGEGKSSQPSHTTTTGTFTTDTVQSSEPIVTVESFGRRGRQRHPGFGDGAGWVCARCEMENSGSNVVCDRCGGPP